VIPQTLSLPPALFKKGEEGRKKKEVLHLSRCYTHTGTPSISQSPYNAKPNKNVILDLCTVWIVDLNLGAREKRDING
jgi:hypothetical protein